MKSYKRYDKPSSVISRMQIEQSLKQSDELKKIFDENPELLQTKEGREIIERWENALDVIVQKVSITQ